MDIAETRSDLADLQAAMEAAGLGWKAMGDPPDPGDVYHLPDAWRRSESGFTPIWTLQLILDSLDAFDPEPGLWRWAEAFMDGLYASPWEPLGDIEIVTWEDGGHTGLKGNYWTLQVRIWRP